MKKIYNAILLLFFMLSCSNAQDIHNYSTNFLISQLVKFKIKNWENRIVCNSPELDSILRNDTILHISRIYDDMPFYPNDSSLILYLTNNKEINWSEADKNCEYINNIYVVFKKNKDNYILDEFIHFPLNQRIMALNYTEMKIMDNKLYIRQYGGNRFGAWETELEFERSEQGWIHTNSKLFSTADELTFEPDKLIWTKKATKPTLLKDICFTDIFSPQELERVIDGAYSE